MKFIFPFLAILVCGGAAYFSLTQSGNFKATQDARILAQDTNKTVSASADKADIDITKERELLDASKKNLDIVTASVQFLQSDSSRLKNELAQLESDLETQDAEFAQLDKALKEVQELFAKMDLGSDVTVENLPDKIAEINEDVKAKREKVDELTALVEGAQKSVATKKKEVSRLVARKSTRDARIKMNSMEARVTAVDHAWGFLVIGAGSNSGFSPQTELLVQRDGKLIAKVSPSAIEATQTIAEIDLETLSPGVRIQPGDSVILAKPVAN